MDLLEVRQRLEGVPSFPVTPFAEDGSLDLARFRDHVEWQLSFGPASLFVAAGAGEFWSLSLAEYGAVVKAAVEVAKGRVPVVAATGYGTPLAIAFAEIAETAGADALLVLPPYLLTPEQAGLEAHYRALAAATRLGLILYQRDNAALSPETLARLTDLPTLLGLKDGLGQMERLLRQRLAVGDRLVFLNGMPTAETSALAFQGVGIRAYSSGVYNFAPALATDFHRALRSGDDATVTTLLRTFYIPFSLLRDVARGYTVSLLKTGLDLIGRPVGRVRPPLVDPSTAHRERLREILAGAAVPLP